MAHADAVTPEPRNLAVVEVNAVRKTFGGLVAVNDISFQTRAGQIVGLIGPNGAGKSTTFNLVTGVLSLSGGEVRFRGQRVDGLASRKIAQQGMSRTFQHVKLVPEMTVLENVALGAHLRGHRGPVAAMARLNRAEPAAVERRERLGEPVDRRFTIDVDEGKVAAAGQASAQVARTAAATSWLAHDLDGKSTRRLERAVGRAVVYDNHLKCRARQQLT